MSVAAIAGLGKCVGAKYQVLPGIDEFVHHCLAAHVVEVVHDLGALVAEPTKGLYLGGPLHG